MCLPDASALLGIAAIITALARLVSASRGGAGQHAARSLLPTSRSSSGKRQESVEETPGCTLRQGRNRIEVPTETTAATSTSSGEIEEPLAPSLVNVTQLP